MNKFKLLLLLSLMTGTIGVQAAPKNASSKNEKTEKSAVLTVELKKPELKFIQGSMPISGNVLAWQEASISGEISGVKIEEVFVDVGSYVKKGKVLARLNNKSLLMDLEQAKASLEEAKANLYVAQENAERVRKLEGTAALSEMQKNQYLAAEKMAKAKVSSANAVVNSLSIKLEQTNVIAPDDGTISERKATVGSIIGTGEMFKMIIKDKLQWQPDISSDKLSFIQRGQKVYMELPNGEKIYGEIDEISPKINLQTRQATLLVNLTKEKHKGKISPGMFLSGEIISAKQEQIVVKKESVVLRDGINYVFVVEEGKAKQKKVVIGKRIGNEVVIKEGIGVNDPIVVQGAGFLKNGDKVRVKE